MVVISMWLFSAVIGLLLLALVRWIVEYTRLVKTLNLPCPPWLPLVGNVHLTKPGKPENYTTFLQFGKLFDKEGHFIFWLGPIPVLLIYRAELIEQFLNSSKHMEKPAQYEFVKPWLGTGLLTSGGEKWKIRRKMLTPAFHFQILNDFVEVFCEQGDTMVTKLDKMADTDQVFDVYPYLTHCALDIICETAMGERLGAQEQCNSEYVNAVYRLSEMIVVRGGTPWQWPDFLYRLFRVGREHDRLLKILHGFTDSVIQRRLSEKKLKPTEETTTKKKRMAFLDLLLHESEVMGGSLTKDDIREEVDTFMFEGHDTTATASSWACYLIGAHQEVQQRLHEEMDRVFGNSDRRPSMDDLKEMTYLECVIKETLRLFPAVPYIGRRSSEPFRIGDCEVPTGTSIAVVIAMVHRDERFFPDAEKFEPDRFSQDEASNRHPFAYIPFSAGPRNCIGQRFAMMELKVELSTLLRRYQVESMQTRDELRPRGSMVLRPDKGILVKLYRRNVLKR